MKFDKNKIKKLAKKFGADLVGIASAESMEGAPPNHKPADFLPDAKSVIAVAVRINYASVDGLPKTRREYVSNGDAARVRINNAVYELARKLEEGGFAAMPFFGGTDYHAMMGDLSLKHAAVAAGLGEFGLNNLFLAPEYGPRVILAAVVTSAEFEPDPPFKGQLCDLCEECLKICPSGALRNLRGYDRTMGWAMDKHRCHHYIATVLEPTYGHFSCGMCIKACHVGKSEK